MPQFPRSRMAALAALGLFALATSAAAQPSKPNDPVDAARLRQKIADQKAEADVGETLAAADRLAKSNPARAAQLLKAAQTNVDLSAAISGPTRKALTTQLQAKLAAVEGRPVPAAGGAPTDPKAADRKAKQAEAVERYLAELKDVREGVTAIEKASNAGNAAAASTEIARLQRLYPHNPAVIVLGQNDSLKARVADAAAFQRLQAERMFAVQKGINESSLPAIRDVEFPANWKELSARRLKTVELTAREQKILEALDKPVSVNFAERPLEEALQDLSNMLDQPLLIDKKSLEDLQIDLKRGTSLNAKGLSGRTVLRSVLTTHGLTFVVRDETIQIVTIEKSRTLLTTKVYYLGDLIRGTGPFGDFRFGPVLNMEQTQANAAALAEAIKKIDPLSWLGEGGAGTVTFHYPSLSLIVRNSAEVHHSLGRSFGPGR